MGILHDHLADMQGGVVLSFRDNGDGPSPNGIIDIVPAVGTRAGDGDENVAGTGPTRVHGQPRDFRITTHLLGLDRQ